MYLRLVTSAGLLLLAGCCPTTSQHTLVQPTPVAAQNTPSSSTGNSDLREAFLHHEALDSPEEKASYAQAGGESFVMSERWKNYQKYAKDCPAIAEVEKVEISKDAEGDYVIAMYGPHPGEDKDGFDTGVCSLWTVGSGVGKRLEVRDFTSY